MADILARARMRWWLSGEQPVEVQASFANARPSRAPNADEYAFQMERDPVEIARAQLLEAYEQLEVVVPSLDRIGSAFPDDPGARAEALRRFVEEWEVFSRLAKARRILT
jgi:hypothetical protein